MRRLDDVEIQKLYSSLDERSMSAANADLLRDPTCGLALRVYLALTDDAVADRLSPSDRFYNRYLWFCKFAIAHRRCFGFDAGIDQQLHQILELADIEIDFGLLQQLEAEAVVSD